jgi:hypothetical protein
VLTTDNNGAYSLPPVKSGAYNIWAEKGDLVAIQNSVQLSSSIKEVSNDTLGNPVTLTATVGLQPNSDPRTVTVQVLGTYKYSNVQQNGRLTIDGLADGNYTLRLVSTLPGYTPTYQSIIVKASAMGKDSMTIMPPIVLIYTGIPVVTGIKAAYDTVSGVVNLQWNTTTCFDFQDYLIYRDSYDSIILSTKPIAWRIDTTFSDTVFQKHLYTADDTNNYHFKYRVAVRNYAGEQGITYRFAEVLAVSPAAKRMRFDFTGSTFDSMEIRPGDTLRVMGKFTSPINTTIESVSWKYLQKGSIITSKTFTEQKRIVCDTLRYKPAVSGVCTIVCSVTDSKAVSWNDTLYYRIGDTALPSDTSVLHSTYYIHGRIGFDTVEKNTIVGIVGYFTYNAYPSLQTITWTDLDRGSIFSVDSLRGGGYAGFYSDSTSHSWSTTGTKRVGCTIMDAWGRMFTDTIQVYVVDERLDLSMQRAYYLVFGAFNDTLAINSGTSNTHPVSVNDTMGIGATFWKQDGSLVSLVSAQWWDLETNAVLAMQQLSAASNSVYSVVDVFKYVWQNPGIKNIGCTVTNNVGSSLTDTLRINVVDSLK